MYDEAFKKLLAIFEIVIKLKCQQPGIQQEYTTAKGQKRTYILKELIDKVCAHEPEKDLKWQLHHARKLRNIQAHPERHSFMGALFYRPFIPLLNAINLLFVANETIIGAKARLASLKQQFSMFLQGLFVLEQEGNNYLISKAEPLQTHQINGTWHTCWSFEPVLTNTYEMLSNHKYSPPIVLTLTNPQLKQGTLNDTALHTNNPIKLYPNANPKYQETLNRHQQDWQRLSDTGKLLYQQNQLKEIHKMLSQFMYQHCWEQVGVAM